MVSRDAIFRKPEMTGKHAELHNVKNTIGIFKLKTVNYNLTMKHYVIFLNLKSVRESIPYNFALGVLFK